MNETVRIAVIGLGAIANEHLAACRAVAGAKIVAVCDVRAENVHARAAEFGARGYTDFRALFVEVEIDLALVLTPASTHRPIVEAAAAAGAHVFCEKPLANRLEDAEAMVAACDAARVKLFYGSIYRYLPAVRTARAMILAGAIGKVLLMSEQMIGGNGAAGYRHLDAVHYPHGGPGGTGMGLVDHGVHLIDIFSWIEGAPPDRVSGQGQISGAPAITEQMTMHFPSGAVGHLLYNGSTFGDFLPAEGMFSGGQSWRTDGSLAPPGAWLSEPASLSVFGTTGAMRIFQFANALFLNDGTGIRQIPLTGRASPGHFITQLEEVLDAITADRAPSIPGSVALDALRALLAVYPEGASA